MSDISFNEAKVSIDLSDTFRDDSFFDDSSRGNFCSGFVDLVGVFVGGLAGCLGDLRLDSFLKLGRLCVEYADAGDCGDDGQVEAKGFTGGFEEGGFDNESLGGLDDGGFEEEDGGPNGGDAGVVAFFRCNFLGCRFPADGGRCLGGIEPLSIWPLWPGL